MRCFKKKGPDRQPSFVLGSQYPAIQYPQAISQDIHLSIHCSIYCYYESPIWPPTIDMSGMSIRTHPQQNSWVDSMWDSTTFGDQQDTVRRKVHGDPPNPRVLHLGIKQTNLTGDGHRHENQSCRYQYGVYPDIPIFFLRNV